MLIFESLPNELLIEVFSFCDDLQLLRAFARLNVRFDRLLFVHWHNYCLNFQSIDKAQFNLVCEHYLPIIADRVRSLSLSDDDETPNLSGRLIRETFANLQFLTLDHLQSVERANAFFLNRLSMRHLRYFRISKCRERTRSDMIDLIDQLWHLPLLVHCNLEGLHLIDRLFTNLTTISLSIRTVWIPYHTLDDKDLVNLCQHTPRLRSLRSNLTFHDPHWLSQFVSVSIRHLAVQITDDCLNGHQWQQIIVHHLPVIQTFRFHSTSRVTDLIDPKRELHELLETFRTPFWLAERRCFVRCHLHSRLPGEEILRLYTLPYCFDTSIDWQSDQWYESTCPNDDGLHAYPHVRRIKMFENGINNWTTVLRRFPNLETLELPFIRQSISWNHFPISNHLRSLIICSQEKIDPCQWRLFFDRARCLHSLTVNRDLLLQLVRFNITKTSIHRLRLNYFRSLPKECFNTDDCLVLADSLLGQQCEVLALDVETRSNVVYLVERMNHLRALTCEIQVDSSYSPVLDHLWYN